MANVTWDKNTIFKKTLLLPVNRIVKIDKNLVLEISNYYIKNVNDIQAINFLPSRFFCRRYQYDDMNVRINFQIVIL